MVTLYTNNVARTMGIEAYSLRASGALDPFLSEPWAECSDQRMEPVDESLLNSEFA